MKGLKLLAVAAMTAAVVLLSGCGNMTMLEEYSFGYVQLKAGNSEVYVMTPFDLAHVSRQNGEGMMYINNDKHINVVAVSETAGETTPVAMAEEYVAMLKQTPDVSDLQTKVTDAEESGRKTTVVDASIRNRSTASRPNSSCGVSSLKIMARYGTSCTCTKTAMPWLKK